MDSPFKFKHIDTQQQFQYGTEFALNRCSGAFEGSSMPEQDRFQFRKSWVGTDPLGRKISVEDSQVLANGDPFLDCSRKEFAIVAPPNWANEW
jgi:hypothetical protein